MAAIADLSTDAFLGQSLDGVITHWSAGARRLFGWSAEEAVGRPVSLLLPPGRSDEWPDIRERLQRGERIAPYETVRWHKDGTRVHVIVHVAPVRDPGGRLLGAAVVARDITALQCIE